MKWYPNTLTYLKLLLTSSNSADATPSKKYLEYLFKIWHGADTAQPIKFTSERLIGWVSDFEALNHLINNKDIYSSVYLDITHLGH
jgi:hypothetical protein